MDRASEPRRSPTLSVDRLCHGLRQPLSVIRAFAELIGDEIAGPLTDGQRDYARTIQRAAEDLERLIQDIDERGELRVP